MTRDQVFVGWVERNWEDRCECSKYLSNPTCCLFPQESSETQLHTGMIPETAKALGFTRFLLDVVCMESFIFLLPFRLLVGAVQPNLRCYSCRRYLPTTPF